MRRRPPRVTRTDTPFPSTSLFRSRSGGVDERLVHALQLAVAAHRHETATVLVLLDHVALGDGDLELGRLADLDVVEAQVTAGVRIHALDVRGVLAAAVDDDHLRGDRGAVVALVPRRGRDADAGTVVEHERRVAPEVEGMLAVDLDVRVAPDPVAFTGLLVEDRHLVVVVGGDAIRSEEHTSELQSLMRISYAV